MLPGCGTSRTEAHMLITMRNRLNHFLLNRLLIVRYHMRKHPVAVRNIIAAERLCIKLGIIFVGQPVAKQVGAAAPSRYDTISFLKEHHV